MSTNPESSNNMAKLKMRRNKQACDQCRGKKAKCDAGLPCQPCKQAHIRCSYSTPKKKRGIPTGYLQNLEKTADRLLNLLGMYLESEPEGESILSGLATRLASSSDQVNARYKRQLQDSKVLNILDLTDLDLTVIKSGLNKYESKDYRVLASQPSTAGVKTSPKSPISNAPSPLSVLSHALGRPLDRHQITNLGPTSGFDSVELSTFQKLHLSQTRFDVNAWKAHLAPFSLTEILDSYFTYIHSILPMVDRTDLIRLVHSEDISAKSSTTILLWSVMFIAFNQMNGRVKSDAVFETRIMHELTTSIHECKHSLQSVQTLTIQALYFWGQGYWSNAWMIIGNAVRMGMAIGINTCDSSSSIFSTRTWKCCCIIDTLISGRLGKVPQVRPEDFLRFDEAETSEEWELWKPTFVGKGPNQCYPEPYRLVSIFNQFHRINKLANMAITQTNKMGYFGSSKEQQLQILIDTVRHTKQWQAESPDHITVEDLLNEKYDFQLLPHRANLYFGYVSMYLMVYLVSDNNHEGHITELPSVEEVAQMTINVLSNVTSRFPSNCLPSFEYFTSLCLIIVYKDGLLHNKFNTFAEMLTVNPQAKTLLDFLEQLSSTWCGASVAHKHFLKMSTSNSPPDLEDSSIYSNFMSSIPNFGDVSDVDFLNSYRVSVFQ